MIDAPAAVIRVVEHVDLSGPRPIEGAVGYIRIGSVQRRLGAKPTTIRVAAGRTTIRSWIRLCNANCNYLTNPSDRCARTVTLRSGSVLLRIERRYGRACRIVVR